jgi:hypothetical protein
MEIVKSFIKKDGVQFHRITMHSRKGAEGEALGKDRTTPAR